MLETPLFFAGFLYYYYTCAFRWYVYNFLIYAFIKCVTKRHLIEHATENDQMLCNRAFCSSIHACFYEK